MACIIVRCWCVCVSTVHSFVDHELSVRYQLMHLQVQLLKQNGMQNETCIR